MATMSVTTSTCSKVQFPRLRLQAMSSTIEKHTNHWESDDAPAARPILPNDSLLSIFGTDQKLAIQGVLSDEQIQWERIHLIRIGNESPQQANPVCILIVLHQSSKQHDAALLAPKIMAKLQNSDETNRQWWRPENKSLDGCSRDLVVTLASMPIELFADGGVELGNTVDTENESGTFRGQGTAGPTLDLFGIDGSHLSRCFLTCHHVVSSLAEPLSRDQENGAFIAAPSQSSLKESLKTVERRMKHFNAASDATSWTQCHADKFAYERLLATPVSQRLWGTCILSSGKHRQRPHFRDNRLHMLMDWSLCEPRGSENWCGTNIVKVEDLPELRIGSALPEDSFPNAPDYRKDIITDTSKMMDFEVFKAGGVTATKGVTGHLNGIRAWDQNGSEEWFVVSESPINPHFATNGDSGALVYNDDGIGVGIVVGGVGSAPGPCLTYITPLSAILADIQDAHPAIASISLA